MKTLYLHVGTHHTGSTSIQHFLQQNRERLEHGGVRVIRDHPSNTINEYNCMSIANAFIRQSLMTPARLCKLCRSDYQDDEILGHLARQLSAEADVFIVSSASLCYLRTDEELHALKAFTEKVGIALVPVVYLREESAWRERRLYQINKNDLMQKMIGSASFELLDDWYFDRDTVEAFFRRVSEKAVILDYDATCKEEGSVIPGFVRLASLPEGLEGLDTRKNTSRK